jgi:predicted RNA binding protein YcfA (HicA-like mRNA interferase family)
MSRAKKLITIILEGRSDANIRFDGLCLMLERAGFTRRSGRGSHTIFYREGINEIINIQPRGDGTAKPYQVKQIRDLVVKYRLEIE